MKLGKVTQTVRKRSVLKQLKSKRREIFPEMTVEETWLGAETGRRGVNTSRGGSKIWKPERFGSLCDSGGGK